ncbi:MAG: ABC transporter substrate-binding protein [Lachnospiraceae bacterium]|nr:ABC transporter substrate-binding protein [Lachnospiraceae bacterium]
MSMKKVMAVLLALAMTCSLAACGNGEGIQKAGETSSDETASTESDGGTAEETTTGQSQIVIGQSTTYPTLDPAYCYEWDSEMVLHAVYDTLVTTNPEDESEIIPCIASDWTISDDNLTYVFTQNEGITFTTGKELTADDVVYCFNRLKGVQGNPSFLMDTGETVEATGDYEVTLTLNTVNPAILSILTRSSFSIYDSEVAQANGGTCDESDTFQAYADSNPSVGSGAYQITTYTSGSEVILEKFADAQIKTGSVDKIIVRTITDANTQQMELEAGDIDFALALTADQVAVIEDEENIQIVTGSTYDIFFLMMNVSEEYGEELADPTVREAIKYAIDYEGLCELAGNDAFVPSGIIPQGFLGYAGESTVTRDVEKAKELLAEAGYADGFSFDCGVIPDMAPDGVSFMMCAEKIQSDLAEVGITMNIISQEASVYLEAYRDGTQQAVSASGGRIITIRTISWHSFRAIPWDSVQAGRRI